MVYKLLAKGRNNAIPGHCLVSALGLKDLRDLTQLVERERKDGFPICASTDSQNPGYYLPCDPHELEEYIRSLSRRIGNMSRTKVHLEDTLLNMTGQQRIDGLEDVTLYG